MSIFRPSQLLDIISMLSSCWYVTIEKSGVYSGHKMKGKDHTVQNLIAKEKDTKEESK